MTFCMAPWTHTYVSPQSERRMCCASREPSQRFHQYIDQDSQSSQLLSLAEHWNSEHMKDVRKRMLAGITLPECEVCNHKLLNTDVYRDYFNNMFGHLKDEVISNTAQDGSFGEFPISYDYRLSNKCNFKCRMCGPPLSSAWQQEENLTVQDFGFNNYDEWLDSSTALEQELIDAALNKRIRELYWVGGEPLLWKEHWDVLKIILKEQYADQVYLRYNTNLSSIQYKGDKLSTFLPRFKDWQICASLDGTGPRGEYIRTGLVYQKWLDNFKELKEVESKPWQMRIDFTLTNLGLLEIENIFELSRELNAPIMAKVCFTFSSDVAMSPLILPRELLDSVVTNALNKIEPKATRLQRPLIDVLKNLLTRKTCAEQWPEDSDGLRRAVGQIVQMDKRRGTSFAEQVQGTEIESWWARLSEEFTTELS